MDDEAWVELEDFPNYAVSNYGEVLNMKFDRSLKPRSNGQGYLRVALSRDGEVAEFYVHQLVATLFMEGYRHGLQIRHEDGDKSNNHVSNLRMRNGRIIAALIREGKPARGRRVRIKETGEVFLSARDCARYIGGDFSSIYNCIRNPERTHKGYTFEYYEENK